MPFRVLTKDDDDVCQLAKDGKRKGKHLKEPECHCTRVLFGEPPAFKACVGAPARFPKDGAGL